MHKPQSIWTDERIEQLKQGWARGDSVVALARALKVSATAISKKKDRLGLPGRDSPIKSAAEQTPASPKRVGRYTLPPLASLAGN